MSVYNSTQRKRPRNGTVVPLLTAQDIIVQLGRIYEEAFTPTKPYVSLIALHHSNSPCRVHIILWEEFP